MTGHPLAPDGGTRGPDPTRPEPAGAVPAASNPAGPEPPPNPADPEPAAPNPARPDSAEPDSPSPAAAAPHHVPSGDPAALRADLDSEYYAILDVVSGFDQRLLIVKGWSVTLSLAALGLGFQQGHFALFGLAACTALAFWMLEYVAKGHQLRYYSRMRDIEVAGYHLNHVALPELGEVSAPRIDMYWSFDGFSPGRSADAGGQRDWRTDRPERRSPDEIRWLLRKRLWMPQVFLPHAVAVALGVALFLGAAAELPGLDQLAP